MKERYIANKGLAKHHRHEKPCWIAHDDKHHNIAHHGLDRVQDSIVDLVMVDPPRIEGTSALPQQWSGLIFGPRRPSIRIKVESPFQQMKSNALDGLGQNGDTKNARTSGDCA